MKVNSSILVDHNVILIWHSVNKSKVIKKTNKVP